MDLKKHVIVTIIVIMTTNVSNAHEPLYGLGPETLPKHLSAIELGTRFRTGIMEYEFGYGFGITQNWTVRIDGGAIDDGNTFGFGNIKFKTKYALWRKTAPGVLKRLTAIAALQIPTADKALGNPNITAFTIGIANGYESRRWYYFSDIGYTYYQSGNNLSPGGKLKYNLVGGIRPIKTDYLKPDLVLLVEINGALSGKNRLDGKELQQTGGNTLAIAPGFLLSYRNIMLKGGIQFGIANSKFETKPTTTGLVTVEYHF
jgi:hypothetical protein